MVASWCEHPVQVLDCLPAQITFFYYMYIPEIPQVVKDVHLWTTRVVAARLIPQTPTTKKPRSACPIILKNDKRL